MTIGRVAQPLTAAVFFLGHCGGAVTSTATDASVTDAPVDGADDVALVDSPGDANQVDSNASPDAGASDSSLDAPDAGKCHACEGVDGGVVCCAAGLICCSNGSGGSSCTEPWALRGGCPPTCGFPGEPPCTNPDR